ncbi:hypothetical protein J5N97_006201 [Dioscorea zingiberensis]|uniref:LisH domain-containing protein n=1 Tax=Dioscorea zingiberensis TaxID=325984 RepID=A0A9D5D9J1_9LILI|nr:hypothetical protein J5N97_006201 [Dioscorea zingiberensis]
MGKRCQADKRGNLGKGKVTPVQIAYIVGRYLADNNYTNTLSAFRSEAADLFSKTLGKEAPKGLMGLGDILDEYISLKEQRLVLDHEKRRLEMALRGIQDVMRVYYSTGVESTSLPSSPPLLPHVMAASTAPFFPAPKNVGGYPTGHIMQGSPIVNHAVQPMLQHKASEHKISTPPAPKGSSANKRKIVKSDPIPPLTHKKSRVQSPKFPSSAEGNALSSEITCTKNKENMEKLSAVHSASVEDPQIFSPVEESSAAQSLFKQPSECGRTSSSPKTPMQEFSSQTKKLVSPLNNSSLHTNNASPSQGIASSSCSIISSTVVVSPLKGKGYCAIERSYHVTSSPLNSNSKKPSKREHIRGRLDFDDFDAPTNSEKQIDTTSFASSTDGESQKKFDFDLTDLDFFNGDFSLSQFLVDLDINFEGIPCQSAAISDFLPGLEVNMLNGCSETNQVMLDPYQSSAIKAQSSDTIVQVPDRVTSISSVTKCIIMSPGKT